MDRMGLSPFINPQPTTINQWEAQTMKIGYGTYGMPEVPVQEALPRLAKLGYEAVELCVGERYDAAPERLGRAERRQVREMLQAEGLELTGLMRFVNLLAPDPGELRLQQEMLESACVLARE